MHALGRLLGGATAATLLVACGSRTLPASTPGGLGRGPAALRARAVSVPAVDLGRRARSAPVKVVVLMRFNHAAQLQQLLRTLARTRSPHYLTPQAFVARFDPTPQQERAAVAALRRAGFGITRRYTNRLLIDAEAPSATVERYFATQMHSFRQGRYGERFANVRPIRIPAELTGLVASVTANDVVRMFAGIQREASALPASLPLPPQAGTARARAGRPIPAPDSAQTPAAVRPQIGGNVIGNPGFESRRLPPWKNCKTTKGFPTLIVRDKHAHGGHFDAYNGSFSNVPYEPNGLTSVCQLVTIPTSATLSIWTRGVTNDHAKNVAQFGALYTSSGKLLKALYTVDGNNRNWIGRTYSLAAYAGQRDYLAFGVVGNSKHKNKYIAQYVDDASLVGAAPTPSPTSTPTSNPTSAPTSAPTSSPTTGPGGTPAPGPSFGPDDGWGPNPVLSSFAFPAEYGYAGAGETAAIVISNTVAPSDLAGYLAYYGITRTGTVTNEPIDGGGPVDNEGEATLDLETIVSLAPAANVIVYDTPDLSDQSIEDAYNAILVDAKASVVNSSFGGCEAGDPGFTSTVESIAVQGAATGVTFSASGGDNGSDCQTGPNTFGASSPASSPDFVGVGGTQSTSPAGPSVCSINATPVANPAVWNDCVGQGGSGISTVFAEPSYQSGISGASDAGRNVPDIAMPAAFDDTYMQGQWGLVWGTSWASPIYVAMQLEINQVCGRHLWGINALYTAFAANGYANDFLDVTGGNNNPGDGDQYYRAKVGFDNVSGIGMPLGMEIAADNGCTARPTLRHARRAGW